MPGTARWNAEVLSPPCRVATTIFSEFNWGRGARQSRKFALLVRSVPLHVGRVRPRFALGAQAKTRFSKNFVDVRLFFDLTGTSAETPHSEQTDYQNRLVHMVCCFQMLTQVLSSVQIDLLDVSQGIDRAEQLNWVTFTSRLPLRRGAWYNVRAHFHILLWNNDESQQ
ncbi:MAG: hypothetical protein ACI9G1_001431 [Pirellulaceae bacterium]|jgi:hypothetical protein